MLPQINAPKHKPKYAIEPNHADRGRGAGVEGQKLGVGLTVLLAQNNSRLDSNEEERSASSLILGLINDSDRV